ncbi:MAG: DUF2267 domain-containing protein [Actinomycetota bacterium]|nr:DUF2267 domain-containing protein [Actinomycetota bacterium]
MERRRRWAAAAVVAAAGAAGVALRPGTRGWRKMRRGLARAGSRLRYAEGRAKGACYRLRGLEPDPAVIDNVLADRIRSSLGQIEHELDLPRVHVMVEHHVALLHGEVGSSSDAEKIEHAVAAVPGVAGVESYLHVGLGPWDTRPSASRAAHRPSAAYKSLLDAAEKNGVSPAAAPLVVRGVLATFADRLPVSQREHLSSHLPADVRPLFTPPRRIHDAPPVRSVRDLVGRIAATTSEVPLERARDVTADVVHALRDLVPGDVRGIAAVLPQELKELWESETRKP